MQRPPFSAGYVRASTDKQELSTQAQTQNIARYVESRKLIPGKEMPPLRKMFEDAATSGRKKRFEERPAGRCVLKELLPGDHLVVIRMDRLGRNTVDILTTIENLKKRGIVLHIMDFFGQELAGTESPISQLMLSMLAAFAQFEGDMISTRTREALAELRRQGRRSNGTPPRGYKFVNGQLVEDHEVMHWMNESVLMWRNGSTFVEIAKHLNAKGVKWPQLAKSGWSGKSVARMIQGWLAQARVACDPATNPEGLLHTPITPAERLEYRRWQRQIRKTVAKGQRPTTLFSS